MIRSIIEGTVTNVKGFEVGTATSGIKPSNSADIMVLHSNKDCTAAGMFTTNQVVGAPVELDRITLKDNNTAIRAVVANSGIANACTGDQGFNNATKMQEVASKSLECRPNQILIMSTGIIGPQLPMSKITKGIHNAVNNLNDNGGIDGAKAIMTTDTIPKYFAVNIKLPEGTISIGAIAKGSGMIHPNMATMLGCITTDACIEASRLQSMLKIAVNKSFNKISIDGDTSTSDTVLLLANGSSNISCTEGKNQELFQKGLNQVTAALAKQIVKDGEGVTKFVTIHVSGAPSIEQAHLVANSIATSPLVKTAFAGHDPNWGRIIVAAGKVGVAFDPKLSSLWIGKQTDEIKIFNNGTPSDYNIEIAKEIFSENEFYVHLDLGSGTKEISVWTGDLTTEYVRINSDYTT